MPKAFITNLEELTFRQLLTLGISLVSILLFVSGEIYFIITIDHPWDMDFFFGVCIPLFDLPRLPLIVALVFLLFSLYFLSYQYFLHLREFSHSVKTYWAQRVLMYFSVIATMLIVLVGGFAGIIGVMEWISN